ncbi:pentatricopeptide repeat-containing protein At1g77360, mitochondrial [Nymphaea colorata]|nr:pentatricopeptide repeat-containing protein At1g77360, mitochondrial [Nymphaea colorata]
MMRNLLSLNELKTLMRQCPTYALESTVLVRSYHQSENSLESTDPTERVCKIMMSSPKLVLEKMLDESGIRPSPDVVERVIERFENAGMQVYRFFRWAEKQRSYIHTVKAYHLVIGSLAKIRQYQLMWDLVNDMRRKSLLNVETFSVMTRRYARAQKVDEAIYTFNVMDKFGVTPNLAAFNSLLGAFCKSKNVRKAQEIFDSMKDRFVPDSKTYSILLEGWGREPNLPKAREVYRDMVENGCEPDIVTYSIMVDILCKAGRMEEAVEVMAEMRSRNCMPNSFIYSILVHQYGTERRIGDAVETFLEMERNGIRADVAVYNALVGAFCKVRKFKNVFRVLQEMENKGVSPNCRTFNILLNSLIDARENDEAYRVFRRMIKCCDPDSDTYTMMIKMFCDMDKLEMALKVWKYMGLKQFIPSMHTFSVLINGLCENGELDKACVLLEEMIEKGIRPSGPTVKRLRKLLLKEGREDVLEFLMEKMNLLIKEPLND